MPEENDKRSEEIQARNNEIWGWLRDNLKAMMAYDPAPRFEVRGPGILGSRGHKGERSPYMEYHREFLKYLETPAVIRCGRRMFEELYETDQILYNFIYLRAVGFSYTQIDAMEVLPIKLAKNKKPGKGGEIKPPEL